MRLSIGVALVACLAACARPVPPQNTTKVARPTQSRGTLASAALFPEVYPLADGCAYVHSSDEPSWYICGGSAARVSGLLEIVLANISPMADGTALLCDEGAQKFYSLRGAEGHEVTEGSPSPASMHSEVGPLHLRGFHFVQAGANAKSAAEAAESAEAASAQPEAPDEDERG